MSQKNSTLYYSKLALVMKCSVTKSTCSNEIIRRINSSSLVSPQHPEPSDSKGEEMSFLSLSWYFSSFISSFNTFPWNVYPMHYRGHKMNWIMNSALKELKGLWSINSHYEGSEKVKWLLAEISFRKCVELGKLKSQQLFPWSRSSQSVKEEKREIVIENQVRLRHQKHWKPSNSDLILWVKSLQIFDQIPSISIFQLKWTLELKDWWNFKSNFKSGKCDTYENKGR